MRFLRKKEYEANVSTNGKNVGISESSDAVRRNVVVQRQYDDAGRHQQQIASSQDVMFDFVVDIDSDSKNERLLNFHQSAQISSPTGPIDFDFGTATVRKFSSDEKFDRTTVTSNGLPPVGPNRSINNFNRNDTSAPGGDRGVIRSPLSYTTYATTIPTSSFGSGTRTMTQSVSNRGMSFEETPIDERRLEKEIATAAIQKEINSDRSVISSRTSNNVSGSSLISKNSSQKHVSLSTPSYRSVNSISSATDNIFTNRKKSTKGKPVGTKLSRQQYNPFQFRSVMLDHILEGTSLLRCSKKNDDSVQRTLKTKRVFQNNTSKLAYSKLHDDYSDEEDIAQEEWKEYVLTSLTKKKSFKKSKSSNRSTTGRNISIDSSRYEDGMLFPHSMNGNISDNESESTIDGEKEDEDDDDDDDIQIAQETASFISLITNHTNQQKQQLAKQQTKPSSFIPELLRGSFLLGRTNYDSASGRNSSNQFSKFTFHALNERGPNAWLWNFSFVYLSALDYRVKKEQQPNQDNPVFLDEKGCWNSNLFTSGEERMVKESIRHYIRLHLSTMILDTDSKPVDVDSVYNNQEVNLDDNANNATNASHITIGSPMDTVENKSDEMIQSEKLAIEFLHAGKYDNAISALKVLLEKQQAILDVVSKYTTFESRKFFEADIAVCNTLRKLTMVGLASGAHRQKEAVKYNAELGKRLHKYTTVSSLTSATDNFDPEQLQHNMRILEAIVSSRLEEGLVHCCCNRVGKALKSWREAIHMIVTVTGYPHTYASRGVMSIAPHLPALFNNIGVLHLSSGALHDSIRTLEESIEFQKVNLRNQNNIDMTTIEMESSNITSKNAVAASSSSENNGSRQFHLENSLYQLATTISNLALVCERNYQYDKAIALLDEALTVFESINADTNEFEELIENNQRRLVHDQAVFFSTGSIIARRETENGSLNETHDTDENSVDSARSSLLFGNADGIPDSHAGRQRRSLATRLAMYQSDHHDFILLGPLHHRQWTTEQRVRESVYVWFGKRIPCEEGLYDSDDEDDSLLQDERRPSLQMERYRSLKDSIVSTVLTYGETTMTGGSHGTSLIQNYKEAIPVDTDGNNVVNAELHLNAIYRQAMLHLDRNEVKDALDLFRMTLRNHRQKYGDIHHLVGTAIHNIGMVHLFARQYDDAIISFQESVNVRVAVLGMDHPDVQLSQMKIGIIQLAIGNLSGARATFWDIRDKSLEVLGSGHPNLAKIMNNIGVVAYECGDIVNALRSFEIAYEYQNRFYEKVVESTSALQQESLNDVVNSENCNSIDVYNSNRSIELAGVATANILCNMGFVYGNDGGEKLEALKLYESALNIFKRHIALDDYRIHDAKKCIDYLIKTSLDAYHSNDPDRTIFSNIDNDNTNDITGRDSSMNDSSDNNKNKYTNSSPGMCIGIGKTTRSTLKQFSLLEERRRTCTLESVPFEVSATNNIHRTSRSESSTTTTSSSCASIALPSAGTCKNKKKNNTYHVTNTQGQHTMINSLHYILNAGDNLCRPMFSTAKDD